MIVFIQVSLLSHRFVYKRIHLVNDIWSAVALAL